MKTLEKRVVYEQTLDLWEERWSEKGKQLVSLNLRKGFAGEGEENTDA